jgi:hypothetical protein
LILPTINTTPMTLLPATMCLWMLVRGLKAGSLPPAVMLGLFYAMFLFFSFTASILGLLMALTAIIGWWMGVFPLRHVVHTAVTSLGIVCLIFAALYLATGFNVITCFQEAVRGHHEQQGRPYDDLTRYLLRSTGNILAYGFSAIPLSILAVAALWAMRGSKTAARSLVTAAIATIVIAGFAGLFYVETERIWIFLTPLLAIGAGYETSRRRDGGEAELPGGIFALVLIISCTQEFLLMHYR